MPAAVVLGGAILLNQIDRARGNSSVQGILNRLSLDAASGADVSDARAYAWMEPSGPLSFDMPWSGKMLDRFAEAVMRAERANPGTPARALVASMRRRAKGAWEIENAFADLRGERGANGCVGGQGSRIMLAQAPQETIPTPL
jgi:hypothetical protein